MATIPIASIGKASGSTAPSGAGSAPVAPSTRSHSQATEAARPRPPPARSRRGSDGHAAAARAGQRVDRDQQRGQQQREHDDPHRPVGQHVAQRDDPVGVGGEGRLVLAAGGVDRAHRAQHGAAERLQARRVQRRPARGPRSPLWDSSTAGSPAAPIGPCSDTVIGSARRIHWPSARGPPAWRPVSPRTAVCTVRSSASGTGPLPCGQPTTHGLRTRAPAMSPSTITASTGPPASDWAQARAPANPVVPPEVETSTSVLRSSRVLNTRASSSSAAVAESSARAGRPRVAVGEHHDAAAGQPHAGGHDGLERPLPRRRPRGSRLTVNAGRRSSAGAASEAAT